MPDFLFPPATLPSLPITGQGVRYPIRRIFCVGRNYAAHAAEMGNTVDRSAPFYFTKSAFSAVESGASVPYPPGTSDYHHEMEFVVALTGDAFRVPVADAGSAVGFYGAGLDMTRRDLQAAAKEKRRSWDLGKDVENGAVLGPLTPAAAFGAVGAQRITLAVNEETRQDALLSDMVWSVEELVSDLSHYYHLGPGDLIMTGTPAGVGPVVAGDRLEGEITGLAPVQLTLTAAE
ncbi:fumarylacetoacetate hydrolase family protein [Oceanibium sediminis]|uniref:fumarylacetoacetate hydrolase family protein n=1 Tax=Oceanibium sediminis TaxID=2026339 RepID=UPI000DD2D5DE|nr:fumarylacetoacetate hydrolase family protein [Oceanibium sediminis]